MALLLSKYPPIATSTSVNSCLLPGREFWKCLVWISKRSLGLSHSLIPSGLFASEMLWECTKIFEQTVSRPLMVDFRYIKVFKTGEHNKQI